MNYYYLTNSTGKDVGCLPQIEEYPKSDYLYDDIVKWDRSFQTFNPNFQILQLASKAKPTDLIQAIIFINSNTLLISEKFLNLLQKFKIDEHVIIPATVRKDDKDVGNYYILKYSRSIAGNVDSSNSQFYTFNLQSKEKKTIKYSQSDIEDFMNMVKSPTRYPEKLCAEILTIKEGFDLDLFSLGYFSVHSIISERLKNAIQESGITGVDFSWVGDKDRSWIKIDEIVFK